jgi:uncharacterized membrane protein
VSVRSERTLRRWLAGLALLGLAVAAYLTIEHARGAAPVCTAGGGCEVVAKSDYATIMGVPVAALGLGAYAALLASALLGGDLARVAGFAIALGGFGFSLYLTYLELFVIDAICQWCVASAVIMTGCLVVTALRLRLALAVGQPA